MIVHKTFFYNQILYKEWAWRSTIAAVCIFVYPFLPIYFMLLWLTPPVHIVILWLISMAHSATNVPRVSVIHALIFYIIKFLESHRILHAKFISNFPKLYVKIKRVIKLYK